MGYFAGGVGALMMILSVANVIMRGIFGAPIYGTVELVGYGGLLMGAFAIAHNELTDGNIMMTLFTDKMRPMQQAYSLGVTSFICIIFYGAIAYRYWAEIFTSLANKGASATLGIPYYLVNIVMFIASEWQRSHLWSIYPARDVHFSLSANGKIPGTVPEKATPPESRAWGDITMSTAVWIGIIGLVVFLALMFFGTPVPLSMAIVGLVGFALIKIPRARCRWSSTRPPTTSPNTR